MSRRRISIAGCGRRTWWRPAPRSGLRWRRPHLQQAQLPACRPPHLVALEPEFWAVLEAAARRQGRSLAGLVTAIDTGRTDAAHPLASALRVFALAERPAG